jgi:hypothetical protein
VNVEASAPDSSTDPLCFIGEELARYPTEAMFRFHLQRHGETWALRMFPQLVCLAMILQGAATYLELPVQRLDVERLRFTGQPRPGDSLILKLCHSGQANSPVSLSAEVWIHHRMVAQGHLVSSPDKNEIQ